MIENYGQAIKQVDELEEFLKTIEVEADIRSHLESDYLAAHEFYDAYKANPSDDLPLEGREALVGLHELYKWIWSAKSSDEFEKLHPHLELLVQSAPKINSHTPMLNPVTEKQDDKTNKFIEAIVGFFAVSYGSNVDLDDPFKSSGGKNPDAIFDFHDQRISVACKTLRSKKPSTILGNIESAAKQITRSECEIGYILLNTMNITNHDRINKDVFDSVEEPLNRLRSDLEIIYEEVMSSSKKEISEIFNSNPKACPVVISVQHSTTRINSEIGLLSTSLKNTIVQNFLVKDNYSEVFLKFPYYFNEFLHNRRICS